MRQEPIVAAACEFAVRRRNLCLAVETGIALANGWEIPKRVAEWLPSQGFVTPPEGEINDPDAQQLRLKAYQRQLLEGLSSYECCDVRSKPAVGGATDSIQTALEFGA